MKSRFLYGCIIGLIIILLGLVMMLEDSKKDVFYGLKPKAIYKQYKIYDLVEQRHLACAEAVEFLVSDGKYIYYFNCLKSDKIYFVSNNETINVHEAYNRGIITKEKLYELGIVDRMERFNVE